MPGPVSTAAAGRSGLERGQKMVPGLSPSLRAAPLPGPGSPPRTPASASPSPSPKRREGGREGRGRAPVSRGVGREPPPVRLETVATATGLLSPATRLQGGDAPSPTSRGAASQGRRERRTLPLAVAGGTSPLWPCQDVPASTAVEGGGGGRSAPWARAGSHVATVVAAGLLGWQQTWGRPSHWACHGRRRQGSGVRTPATPTPHPLPDPPPNPTAPTASEMACHELGASKAKVPTRVEERCSPPSSSWPEHVPNGSLGSRWVSLLLFSSHILQGGVGAVWAGAKDTADPGKLKPRPNGSTQPIVWITSVPFLSEHKAQTVLGGMQVGQQAGQHHMEMPCPPGELL